MPDVHVWIADDSTVVGVDGNGSLIEHAGSRILRDDTEQLREVAAMAAAWYAVRVTRRGILREHEVGVLLDAVQAFQHRQTINSVVTRRSWDFSKLTTTTVTAFAELDIGGRV